MILIVTIEDDVHALAVKDLLERRGIEVQIIESDRMASEGCIQYSLLDSKPEVLLRFSAGKTRSISDVGLIWWRRGRSTQRLESSTLDVHHDALINNDCHGALRGSLESSFCGKWISDPASTEKASNKLLQLTVAAACGFRVPATLVTQSPSDVNRFYDEFEKKIIFKPVVGTAGPLLFTQFVHDEHLARPESIRICPTIYQEYIPGTRHIRLNCFGSKSFASVIETSDLDWRPNLAVPVRKWSVPMELHCKVRRVLDQLGLEMGILDLKETPSGEIVWFEVNPQGQFLFLEGLTGEPMTKHFADYLEEESQISA